jgi:hypothetical protein
MAVQACHPFETTNDAIRRRIVEVLHMRKEVRKVQKLKLEQVM